MFIVKPTTTNSIAQKLEQKYVLLDTEQQVAVGYFYEEKPANIAAYALNMNATCMLPILEQLVQMCNELRR